MLPYPVQVEHLTRIFSRRMSRRRVTALDDVSLVIEPGEVFGLLGPNGAGKTTLVKILLDVVRPTSGRSLLFGIDSRHPDSRLRIGYLPENHRPPEHLTPVQMLDLFGRLSKVPAEKRRRRIPELIELLGMGEWSRSRIGPFSKGMKQRIGLAQALLNEPDLVILDEPTDGVDPIGRREIREILLQLRGQGVTVFLNSHLLAEVDLLCTRVAILDRGRIVFEGGAGDLASVDRVVELVSTPIPTEVLAAFGEMVRIDHAAPPAVNGEPVSYRIYAPDRTELNAVLDRVRAAGVEIEALRPLRQSLEDFFIETIRNGHDPEAA